MADGKHDDSLRWSRRNRAGHISVFAAVLKLCASMKAVPSSLHLILLILLWPRFAFKLVGKRRGKEGTKKRKRSVKIRGNLDGLFRGIHFCRTCSDSRAYYVVGREEERNNCRKSRKCCERRNYWDKSRERHQDQQYQTVCTHSH